MLRTAKWTALFFVFLGVSLVGIPPASAQSASNASAISDEQLENFADAYVKITEIRRQYEPAWREAEESRKGQVADTANERLQRVLDTHNLTPYEYNMLFDTISRNEALQNRVLVMIRQKRQGS